MGIDTTRCRAVSQTVSPEGVGRGAKSPQAATIDTDTTIASAFIRSERC